MEIKNFFKGLTILLLASVCLSSFADKAFSSAYIDSAGYCVVSIPTKEPSKYTEQNIIQVPDIKGHILRSRKTRQQIANSPLCHDDTLVLRETYGISDYIDHDGFSSGYTVFTTGKGEKIFVKWGMNSQKEKGKDLASYQATGRILGGTGNYSAAKGTYQSKGYFDMQKELINVNRILLRYKISIEAPKKEKSSVR
ncbi:MAG: hypothetical protein QNL94_07840 [Halioglobus sp.]|jgi:hypothetical protein|tara:strand:- start:1048 stop:1635 length:588 start_codon:yes stop_codon:yes gene_type:complete